MPAVAGFATPLKLTAALAVGGSSTVASAALFNCIANVSLGIVIVQLTQQVQTMEQVAVPLAANGARVYLTPWEFNESIGWSKNYYFDMEKDYGSNFGSKILGDVKHAAQWIAPTLHKVLSTVVGPVGMIHPGIGGVLGAGAGLAGAVDRPVNKR
ncbi:MAG: hypothetical protein EZS28_047121 [Streblomastix strix]|uniref:Uncharacterized protein n=1 Tax=Streblomastix strix TaxID=222440 RepID=A0A5J4THK8_9EUKA|nr:MAG: hypothetical protein EZS28_047121 [Streblomastix strix]